MTPGHRAWAERFVARLQDRIDRYARIGVGREGEAVIVASLQYQVARHRGLLDAPIATGPIPPTRAVMPASDRYATAWSDAVFWQDGIFDPFAGTRADRMRASAATCRKLGYDAAAVAFDRHAFDAGDGCLAPVGPDVIDALAQAHLATIAPFTAGPQLALFA